MKILSLCTLMLAWAPAVAQNDKWEEIEPQRLFVASGAATLSNSSTRVTIQQPASPTRLTVMESAWVQAEQECPAAIERNGTAATGAAAAQSTYAANPPGNLNIEVFHESNVGPAAVFWPFRVAAGGNGQRVSLRGQILRAQGRENISILIGPCTGVVRYSVRGGQR